jgi:hypothetical protein
MLANLNDSSDPLPSRQERTTLGALAPRSQRARQFGRTRHGVRQAQCCGYHTHLPMMLASVRRPDIQLGEHRVIFATNLTYLISVIVRADFPTRKRTA